MSIAKPILIVDDDEDIRSALGMVLGVEGYSTAGAIDGVDALEHLRSHADHPSLILLDLMMPRLNGVELMHEIRADPSLADIPVVIFSGDTAACRTAASLGAQCCLPKPVDTDELLTAVDRYVARDG